LTRAIRSKRRLGCSHGKLPAWNSSIPPTVDGVGPQRPSHLAPAIDERDQMCHCINVAIQ
jgi:hypothetical protein